MALSEVLPDKNWLRPNGVEETARMASLDESLAKAVAVPGTYLRRPGYVVVNDETFAALTEGVDRP